MEFKKVKIGIQWIIMLIIMITIGVFIICINAPSEVYNNGRYVGSYSSNVSSILAGCFFIGFGIFLFFMYFMGEVFYNNKLIENGKYVICTDIQHEFKENGYSKKGDGTIEPLYCYFTKCYYTDESGHIYEFISETYNKKELNPYNKLDKIYVFVDIQENPKKYYLYPYVV